MNKFPKQDKSYLRKLTWVEHEFYRPAFEQYCKEHHGPLTPDEYMIFVTNLFTEKSKVKVLTCETAIDFVRGETIYCCILGYVDNREIKATKPIIVRCTAMLK